MLRFLFFLYFSFALLTMKAGFFGAGVMFGVNATNAGIHLSDPLKNSDSKLGYNFNSFFRIKISSFIIQPEIGYAMHRTGLSVIEKSKLIETTLNNGEIYLSTVFGFKLGSLRFMGGPIAYSILTENTTTSPISDLKLHAASSSPGLKFGGQLGLGIDVSKHFTIDARYQKILTQSFYTSNVENVVKGYDGNMGSLSLSIGYSFIKM
jgi:hypothetical protein